MNPCAATPCSNGGVCTHAPTADNFAKYTCSCMDGYDAAQNCDVATSFNFKADTEGYTHSSAFTSAELSFLPAIGVSDMYLAILKVTEMSDDAVHKVVLVMKDETSIVVVDSKQTDSSVTKTEISGLTFAAAATVVKVYMENQKMKVDVGSVNKFSSAYDISSFDGIMFGGTLGDCAWDSSEACGVVGSNLNSAARYTDYVGSFTAVKMGDDYIKWETLKEKAEMGMKSCTGDICKNGGICSLYANKRITCTCLASYHGFDCNLYNHVSFNGYTDTYQPTLPNLPVFTDSDAKLTLVIKISRTETEAGEILQLKLNDNCDVRVSAAADNKYKLGTDEIEVIDDTITVTFDGSNATVGEVGTACTFSDTFITGSSTTLRLGGEDPESSSETTLKDSRFQGCAHLLTINGVDVLLTLTTTDLTVDACVNDLLPDDPCQGDSAPACKNGITCRINEADYKAKCDCVAPYLEGALCDMKNYCTEGNECNTAASSSTCHAIDTIEQCRIEHPLATAICEQGKVWYYYCECAAPYKGTHCKDRECNPWLDDCETDWNEWSEDWNEWSEDWNEWGTEWNWNEWGTEEGDWSDYVIEAYFGGVGVELNVPGIDDVEVHLPEMEVKADWYDIMQVLRDLWD